MQDRILVENSCILLWGIYLSCAWN